jgi:cytochrome P450
MTARSPFLEPGFPEDPHPAIDRLRVEDPVHYIEGLGVWAVTRFDDVRELFGDSERVTARRSAASGYVPPPEGSFQRWFDENGLPAMAPMAHAHAHQLASQTFTPRAVARMETQAHEVVMRIAAPLQGRRGVVDLVGEFTNRIPNAVISRITGVPPAADDEARFGALARDTVRGFFPFAGEEARAATERAGSALADWVREMAAERLRRPQDDLISDLCLASQDGDRLTPEDVVVWVTSLIAAGSDTTAMAGTNALVTLLDRPADLARLRAERHLLPRAVNEVLRFTLTGSLPRYALRDFELRGRTIRRGDTLLLCLAGANRDPAVYPDPHRFALDREIRQVAFFGNGERYCIGANLARAELAWMIGAALDFLPTDARVLHEQAKRSLLGLAPSRPPFALRYDTLPVDFGRV